MGKCGGKGKGKGDGGAEERAWRRRCLVHQNKGALTIPEVRGGTGRGCFCMQRCRRSATTTIRLNPKH